MLLTAFYLPLNNWALRGMEVGAVALGVSLAVWAALRCVDGASYEWWLLPLLGLLTTVRMDAAVAGVAIIAWLLWAVPQRRILILVLGASSLAFFVGGQLIVSKLYYHDWLPNTYYLKLEHIGLLRRVVWGVYVLFHFCMGLGLWLIGVSLLYALANRSKTIVLILAVISGQVAYSIYVGGDAWEWWGGANRYLCVAMPMLFILVAAGLALLGELLTRATTTVTPQLANAFVIGLGLLALVEANSYQPGIDSSLAQSLLLRRPPEWKTHRDKMQVGLRLKKLSTPQARIAVAWAGTIPYFAERKSIDLLGKSDRRIAHGPEKPFEPPPLPFFSDAPVPYCWPGHTKRDSAYSIVELKPDVMETWPALDPPEVRQFLRENYLYVMAGETPLLVNRHSTQVKFPNTATP